MDKGWNMFNWLKREKKEPKLGTLRIVPDDGWYKNNTFKIEEYMTDSYNRKYNSWTYIQGGFSTQLEAEEYLRVYVNEKKIRTEHMNTPPIYYNPDFIRDW